MNQFCGIRRNGSEFHHWFPVIAVLTRRHLASCICLEFDSCGHCDDCALILIVHILLVVV